MRVEEERKLEELGEAILDLRTQQSSREVRRADAAARATPRPQGPLQMTGAPCPQNCCNTEATAMKPSQSQIDAYCRTRKHPQES